MYPVTVVTLTCICGHLPHPNKKCRCCSCMGCPNIYLKETAVICVIEKLLTKKNELTNTLHDIEKDIKELQNLCKT